MPAPARLPNWSYEETLLAYDLYLREYATPVRHADRNHAAVQALSRDLRRLTIHPDAARSDPRFRNPDGVARKVQNLMYEATGGAVGAEHGSAMDARVVRELTDGAEVARLAARVRSGQRLDSPAAGDARVTLAEYQAAASASGGDLEREVLSRRRTEQRFLREYLLEGRTDGTCAFCGSTLPADLLVAAHIQRRADLSLAQKLRFDEIAVLACSLGCDALFEQGYIAVAGNGRIVATEQEAPADLRNRLDVLEGRSCDQHTPSRAAYFQAHLRERLRRT